MTPLWCARDQLVHLWVSPDPVPGRVRQTACGLSVPANLVLDQRGPMCVPCLIAAGNAVADENRWQSGL